MALAKTGAGITDIRGGIAGNVFTRDRSGLHCNPHGRTIKKRSALQDRRRKAFRQCVNFWHNSVSETHRQLWQIFAGRHPKQNKVGETIILTSYASFLTINMYRAYNDVSLLAVPPDD